MNPDAIAGNITLWVVVWFATALFLLARHWRSGGGVGILLTYVVSFGSIHWLAPILYMLPWYQGSGADRVFQGMKLSAIAMLAFAAGAELMSRFLSTRAAIQQRAAARDGEEPLIDRVATTFYLSAGLFLYIVVTPIVARAATLSAIVNTGSAVIVIAIGLRCWNAWHSGNPRAVGLWLLACASLPLITVATQGFLGYGMAAMVTVYAFVAAFYGPRWKVLVAGILMAYVGLSVYVTYMRDRGEIRTMVWGGSKLQDRINKVSDTLGNFEWFDIHNGDHLFRIDNRLNQDWLVGAAVEHLEGQYEPYARGSTYAEAVLAVIPRAWWPGKPMSAGSGDLVSTYTGITFDKNTSVGLGQLMECYVNFATWGVVTGFFVIGALVILVDRKAYAALHTGDIGQFALWYLPGLSLLNVGGSFVEATSSAGASLAMTFALNTAIKRSQKRHLQLHPESVDAVPGRSHAIR
jgi:hypothetical protein